MLFLVDEIYLSAYLLFYILATTKTTIFLHLTTFTAFSVLPFKFSLTFPYQFHVFNLILTPHTFISAALIAAHSHTHTVLHFTTICRVQNKLKEMCGMLLVAIHLLRYKQYGAAESEENLNLPSTSYSCLVYFFVFIFAWPFTARNVSYSKMCFLVAISCVRQSVDESVCPAVGQFDYLVSATLPSMVAIYRRHHQQQQCRRGEWA